MTSASSTRRIAVLNGPNLNLLGTRQPEIYGSDTLKDIENSCQEWGVANGFEIDFRQTNFEGELVSFVQDCRLHSAILINAAAYTHTSVAVLDALLAVESPCIEVHLSSPHKREEFRHKSVIATACTGVIAGFGRQSYRLALDAAASLIDGS